MTIIQSILDHATLKPRPELPQSCCGRIVEVGPAFVMGERIGEGRLQRDAYTGHRGCVTQLDSDGVLVWTRVGEVHVHFNRVRLVCPRTGKVTASYNDRTIPVSRGGLA